MDSRLEGSSTAENLAWQMISIDVLPDDILLAIFDFLLAQQFDSSFEPLDALHEWRSLVHVCRRWRSVVFGSPRRLNLAIPVLACAVKTPARAMLDVWPALPLIIQCRCGYPRENVDSVIAALKCSDRVRLIDISSIQRWHLKKFSAAMQEPFPELIRLKLLAMRGGTVPVLPDSFLGGSAPRLQSLELNFIPFPGLPKLLLSATQLSSLHLHNIPHSGYFSPEAMATAFSMLVNLEHLDLDFQSSVSHPDWGSRPPPVLAHSVLPVLRTMGFRGVSEYLDDLVAHIDAPLLAILTITFFNQIISRTSQFNQFISRIPNFAGIDTARITFDYSKAGIYFGPIDSEEVDVVIPYGELDRQLPSLVHVCSSSIPPIFTLERLYIHECRYPEVDWQDNIENIQWVELLQPFTSVKNLYLSEEFASRIAPALQELVGGRTTDVLPNLQKIFLPHGLVHEGIGQFVSARQATSHPIAVAGWVSVETYWRCWGKPRVRENDNDDDEVDDEVDEDSDNDDGGDINDNGDDEDPDDGDDAFDT